MCAPGGLGRVPGGVGCFVCYWWGRDGVYMVE